MGGWIRWFLALNPSSPALSQHPRLGSLAVRAWMPGTRPGTMEIGMRNPAYFGLTEGSPPGLPGGGMTGVLPPVSGAGACISGSTPEGGQSTPSDLASLSPSGSRDWPVVVPSD